MPQTTMLLRLLMWVMSAMTVGVAVSMGLHLDRSSYRIAVPRKLLLLGMIIPVTLSVLTLVYLGLEQFMTSPR